MIHTLKLQKQGPERNQVQKQGSTKTTTIFNNSSIVEHKYTVLQGSCNVGDSEPHGFYGPKLCKKTTEMYVFVRCVCFLVFGYSLVLHISANASTLAGELCIQSCRMIE
jgi:hypothetical protein